MNYLSVAEMAKKWGVSERTVRNYCAQGRIPQSFIKGKIWYIPEDARRPQRSNQAPRLLEVLRQEKVQGLKGGIYHKIQIELTYNSNHIEGSRLTQEQTRYIYETNTLGVSEADKTFRVDDIIETVNHFRCIHFIIEHATKPLSEALIKELHFLLKRGTSDADKDWFAVGEYKKLPNEVGGNETSPPEQVALHLKTLIQKYNQTKHKTLEELLDFHYKFEKIHPFQDGNGRVGRLILFKECLKYNIVPFILDESLKLFYYRGLQAWESQKGYLLETCLLAQDRFKLYLDYFRIPYK